MPTPARAAQPSWPQGSWLQLVPHVPCRHLGRFPEKGGFDQLSCKDSPGEACQPVPAGAHQPCREEAAPTVPPAPLTKCPLPWASTISPGSVTFSVSIPSHSSLSTSPTPEPLFPLESLSPWPLALSPSSPSPSHARACPPPPTPASALLPAGSTLSPTQGDSMALVLAPSHTGHLHTPLKDQLSQALSIQAVLHQPWHGDRRQPKPGASPP